MADVEFTQDVAGRSAGASPVAGGIGTLTKVAGAVTSLALLVGVGFWGYELVMRDVTGIPVVRAKDGPMRIQPDDPGGRPADHQGLAVNSVIAQGTAQQPADTLVLAPRPVSLSTEDVAGVSAIRPAARPEPAQTEQADVPASAPNPDQNTASAEQAAQIDALVEQITQGVPPIEAPAPVVAEPPVVATVAAASSAGIPADVPGVARSLRPQKRPLITPQPAAARGSPEPSVVAASVEVSPDDVPAGTRVVQLGAYEDAEMARREWDRLSVQFGDYLQDKQRVVQQASSGGRTFFRLRALGFDDLSDARRFCSALVAEGADCIPVVTR